MPLTIATIADEGRVCSPPPCCRVREHMAEKLLLRRVRVKTDGAIATVCGVWAGPRGRHTGCTTWCACHAFSRHVFRGRSPVSLSYAAHCEVCSLNKPPRALNRLPSAARVSEITAHADVLGYECRTAMAALETPRLVNAQLRSSSLLTDVHLSPAPPQFPAPRTIFGTLSLSTPVSTTMSISVSLAFSLSLPLSLSFSRQPPLDFRYSWLGRHIPELKMHAADKVVQPSGMRGVKGPVVRGFTLIVPMATAPHIHVRHAHAHAHAHGTTRCTCKQTRHAHKNKPPARGNGLVNRRRQC